MLQDMLETYGFLEADSPFESIALLPSSDLCKGPLVMCVFAWRRTISLMFCEFIRSSEVAVGKGCPWISHWV